MNNTRRFFYLDNLKICLTLLVIFHHAGQAYGDGGGWGYHPSNADEFIPGIWHFFSVNAAFMMGLFFLISGYFVPCSFDKQGVTQFMWKKFLRLGVPFLIMGGLLSLLSGKIELAHTWFLEQLLFYTLIYALIRLISKRTIDESKQLRPTLLLLFAIALGLSVVDFFVIRVSPQDSWIWLFGFLRSEPAHLPQYVVMFVLGVIAYRKNWFELMPKKVGLTCLVLGILMTSGIYCCGNDSSVNRFIYSNFAFYESFLCVSISFGLLWLFRQMCNVGNQFLSWMAAQSYGAYFFHVPLMLIIQNMADKLVVGSGGVGKFLFIGIVTAIASYGLTWLVRLIPGVKKVL